MKRKRRIYFFIGTTAELIKLAPIIKELKRRKVHSKIITTGQVPINFAMFKKFTGDIKSDIAFREKKNKSSMVIFFFWALRTIGSTFVSLQNEFKGLDKSNSYFIIHGDTVSSTIGAILAKLYGLKLVHIESGYFSFNFFEPFPEEICRSVNTFLADILFSPTDWAKNNLEIKKRKGLKISTKENTMVETFLWAIRQRSSLVFAKRKYFILIMHRQEHVFFRKDWSRNTLQTVIEKAPANLDCLLINYPLTVELVKSTNLDTKKIKVIDPLPYTDFIQLMKHAEFIASDGATNQQEAYYLGKPLLALRDYTEQSEGMDKNVLLSKSKKSRILNFMKNYKRYVNSQISIKKRPSKIVVDYLLNN